MNEHTLTECRNIEVAIDVGYVRQVHGNILRYLYTRFAKLLSPPYLNLRLLHVKNPNLIFELSLIFILVLLLVLLLELLQDAEHLVVLILSRNTWEDSASSLHNNRLLPSRRVVFAFAWL